MAEPRKIGGLAATIRRLAARLRVLGLGGLVLVFGCHAGNRNTSSDPLYGPVTPSPGGPPPATTTGNPTPIRPLPAMPAPRSATSPAALAPGSPTSLDPNGGLRIADPNKPNPQPSQPAGVWRGQAPATGVALNHPEPPEPNVPPPPPPVAQPERRPAAGFSFWGNGRTLTYEQAQAVLTQRGVTWQRLETWGDDGSWKFSCSIPNRANPHIRRTYEAKARDPILAMRAVLDQMEKEQH